MEVTVQGVAPALTETSELFFQNQINLFLDTLIQQIYILIVQMNNFPGDLSDVSAKTAALIETVKRAAYPVFFCQPSYRGLPVSHRWFI